MSILTVDYPLSLRTVSLHQHVQRQHLYFLQMMNMAHIYMECNEAIDGRIYIVQLNRLGSLLTMFHNNITAISKMKK